MAFVKQAKIKGVHYSMSIEEIRINNRKKLVSMAVFLVITLGSVYMVKWNPYYHKMFIAMNQHSIGSSIITGKGQKVTAVTWTAAVSYTSVYFKDIWQALIAGILIGSLVQTLMPRDWIKKVLGGHHFKNIFLSGIFGLPTMMCTCCSSPIVVGMKRAEVSTSAAIAFWMSNTALNPAVLVFMVFVLPWKFVVLRILLGIILVFGISYFVGKLDKSGFIYPSEAYQFIKQPEVRGTFWIEWVKNLRKLIFGLLPAYIVSVLALGALRAWLFPSMSPALSNSFAVVVLFAITGTLFVIPTAGEIPIVQTLQSFGVGNGPLAALMITLPVISLPSMLMVSRAIAWRILLILAACVVILGVVDQVRICV